MAFGIFRSTQFALQNASRNLWLSLITVFLLVLTTLSITIVGSINIIGGQLLHAVESKVDVDLYFHDYAKESEILRSKDYLLSQVEVASVIYITKEEALATYTERHADDPAVLEALEEIGSNPLPASFVVRTNSIDDYDIVIADFQNSEFGVLVDHADYSESQDVIKRLSTISTRASQVGVTVSIVFVVISIIVIFNALRIAIYSHKEEIGIMKLVGATNGFIRSPFVVEGILMGLFAAFVTIGVTYAAVQFSDKALTSFFVGYDFSLMRYFSTHFVEFVALEVAGAVLLSTGSTIIALSRHLKV